MISRIATTRPSVLRAELLRWKGSPPHLLVHLVTGYGVVLTAMFLFSGMPHTWPAMLGWDNVWAVTVGPLYAVLLGTAVTAEDRRTRAGGTLWRPVPVTRARLARVAVLDVHLLAANVLALVLPLVGCRVGGFAGATPWADVAALVVVCTAAQAVLAVLGLSLARVLNPAAALAIGCVLALSWFAGDAESAGWWRMPGSWLVRGTLPLTGTHVNGVALAATDPVRDVSPWPPALLCLALAATLTAVDPASIARFLTRLRNRPARGDATPSGVPAAGTTSGGSLPGAMAAAPSPPAGGAGSIRVATKAVRATGRPRPALALLTVVARTTVPWIPVVLLGLGLVLLRWRPARDAGMLEATVLVPLSASVLPIALWSVLGPGWRAIGVRPTRFHRPAWIAVGGCIAWSSLLVGLVMAVLATEGLTPAVAARGWACCTIATAVVTSLVSWLSARYGTAVAGGVSVFGIILGTLVGGTGLLTVLWPFVPWAWGALAAPVPVLLSALVAVAATPLLTRLAARAGIRSWAAA